MAERREVTASGSRAGFPLAPASAGLRLAMLSYGFIEVTGHVVDIAQITAFTFGVGALVMLTGLIVGLGALGAELGTWSPRHAIYHRTPGGRPPPRRRARPREIASIAAKFSRLGVP